MPLILCKLTVLVVAVLVVAVLVVAVLVVAVLVAVVLLHCLDPCKSSQFSIPAQPLLSFLQSQ